MIGDKPYAPNRISPSYADEGISSEDALDHAVCSLDGEDFAASLEWGDGAASNVIYDEERDTYVVAEVENE